MYTRFKSQKAGIKHGLTQIANSTRSRVVIPSSTNIIDSKIDNEFTNILNNNKIDPLSLSSSSTSSLSSTGTNSILISLINQSGESIDENEFKPRSNKTKKAVKHVANDEQDEIVDPNCISYVRSLWEQYSSEIGTQNGPLRYVENTTDCEHLNGFVPLDMESWWAERSISTMINEKSLANNLNTKNNSSELVDMIETQLNENNSLDLKNKNIQYKLMYKASAKSIMPIYQNFNSFNLCFT